MMREAYLRAHRQRTARTEAAIHLPIQRKHQQHRPQMPHFLQSQSRRPLRNLCRRMILRRPAPLIWLAWGIVPQPRFTPTSLNQLKALEDFDGYKVTYTSFPEASARIMEGPRGVKEGESLTFGVKTQLGYTIDNVTANDEDLEADSVTDELDGSQTAWYTISEVYEEQNIQVYTLETLEHPAFDKSVEVNGVTIRITAPEGGAACRHADTGRGDNRAGGISADGKSRC